MELRICSLKMYLCSSFKTSLLSKHVKIFCLLITIHLATKSVFSQENEFGVWAGTSVYLGDLNPTFSFKDARWASGAFFRYNINNRMAVRAELNYGYLDAADYSSTTYTGNSDKSEWTIRPDVSNQYVALSYLKYQTPVSLITDSIEFPKSLTSLIVDLCLNRIAFKQGTQNLYTMSAQNINRLVSLLK